MRFVYSLMWDKKLANFISHRRPVVIVVCSQAPICDETFNSYYKNAHEQDSMQLLGLCLPQLCADSEILYQVHMETPSLRDMCTKGA